MVEVALGEGTVGQQQGSPGVEPRDDNKSRRRGWQRVTSFYTSNCSSSGNVTGHVLIKSEGDPVPLEQVPVATEVGDV